MKNRDKTVMLVVAFVAVIAIVGVSTFNRYETKKKAEQAKVEETEEKVETKEPVENIQSANTNKVEAEIEKAEEKSQPEETKQEEKKQEGPAFSEKETIMWPIDGDVILNFSMDQTIHFPTLDQYKYNPALVISGDEGQPVLAAADGIVKKIYDNAQTGKTVIVDLGNGYEAIYGQLEELRVVEGQKLVKEDVIGYIAKPTKYYTVEGPNLYFQMLKDGEPVNPLEYMEE